MDEILKYFPNLTDIQKEQFEKLDFLYHDWNEKINVYFEKRYRRFVYQTYFAFIGNCKIIKLNGYLCSCMLEPVVDSWYSTGDSFSRNAFLFD